jgi:hypothetical protein
MYYAVTVGDRGSPVRGRLGREMTATVRRLGPSDVSVKEDCRASNDLVARLNALAGNDGDLDAHQLAAFLESASNWLLLAEDRSGLLVGYLVACDRSSLGFTLGGHHTLEIRRLVICDTYRRNIRLNTKQRLVSEMLKGCGGIETITLPTYKPSLIRVLHMLGWSGRSGCTFVRRGRD